MINVTFSFLDNNIEYENKVFSVNCENKNYFYRIVSLFNDYSNSIISDELRIYFDDKEVNGSRIQLYVDYFNFDLNSKKTISKIISLVKNKIDDNIFLDLNKKYESMLKVLKKSINDIELSLEVNDEYNIEDFLKLLNIKIKIGNNLLKNLINLIDLEKELHLNDLIIFVNLKQYLSKDDLIEFYKYSIYNNVNILLIDNIKSNIINYEKVLYIDDDLSEFMI